MLAEGERVNTIMKRFGVDRSSHAFINQDNARAGQAPRYETAFSFWQGRARRREEVVNSRPAAVSSSVVGAVTGE